MLGESERHAEWPALLHDRRIIACAISVFADVADVDVTDCVLKLFMTARHN
jgi:hypothetical protein